MPPGPRLSAEERALWARVAATVKPLGGQGIIAASEPPAAVEQQRRVPPNHSTPADRIMPPPTAKAATRTKDAPSDTLDGGWDRRLRRGAVAPDREIDLHGHTLATAHAALEQALARAVADDVRVLLVVTGKPPKPEARGRGLIRANIGDWLGSSFYRDRIAAIRHAHPRHGGTGALYLILRRKRGG
jgi:DNA-nicking Smr family endonuclease